MPELCAQLRELYGFDVCAQFAPELADPTFTFPGFLEPVLPKDQPLGQLVPGTRTVGIGCPQVLTQQGYAGQDNLAVQQLQQAGCTIPVSVGQTILCAVESTIIQIRRTSGGGIETRRCFFPDTPMETASVVAALNAAGGL